MTQQNPPDRTPRITDAERETRRAALRARMAADGVDAVLLTPGSNMRYFLDFPWGATERLVAALVTADKVIFICPKFEDTALLAVIGEGFDTAYWEEHEDPNQLVASLLGDMGGRQLGIDPAMSFGMADRVVQAVAPLTAIDATPLIAPLRYQKSDAEIALLTAAKQLTLDVHRQIFEWIKPGVRASEVRAEIDRLHRAGGADGGNTFCAVQFGEATSHPHGVPGDQVLAASDLILIDTGCQVGGYHSDITRTYALSKQSAAIEQHWALEKQAQAAAFAAAKPGEPCSVVDKTAREVLAGAGLGPEYQLPGLPHRTGHGIGLDIHEGPYLVRGDDTPLARGMSFSNEPMIVVPREYGIRLEDHFYMTDTGPRWFTEPQADLYQPFA